MRQGIRLYTLLVLIWALLAGHGHFAFGAVHMYNGEGFYTKGDSVTFQGGREGLYKSKRVIGTNEPLPAGIRNGFSYINFEHLTFYRSNRSAAEDQPDSRRHLEILVFELNDRTRIGYRASPSILRLCCDEELVNQGVCTTPGRLIIQSSGADDVKGGKRREMWPSKTKHGSVSMDSPWVSLVTFDPGATEALAPISTWSPPKKGMYYLWFLSCEADRIDDLEVRGYTEWKNPHGYLPGMMAPYLPFYMALSMAAIILAFWWFRRAVTYWREITTLQILLSVVLALTMVEIGLWYVDFHDFNRHGVRPYETTVWATIVGCGRKTFSRVLVTLVCMGYGVLRPTIDGLSPRVLVLALAYACAVVALDLVTFVGAITDLTPATRMILIIPVAILDTLFLVWMFSSLGRVIGHLHLRRRTTKLHLYRRFSVGITLYALASFAFGIYELFSRFSDADNEHWETDWLVSGYWHFLALAALAGTCLLWQPSKMSMTLAYSEDYSGRPLQEEEDDREVFASLDRARSTDPAEYLNGAARSGNSLERRAEAGQLIVSRQNAGGHQGSGGVGAGADAGSGASGSSMLSEAPASSSPLVALSAAAGPAAGSSSVPLPAAKGSAMPAVKSRGILVFEPA